jgi:hypothetical protein
VYLSAEREQDLKTLRLFDQNLYSAPYTNQVVAKFYGHQDICDAAQEFSLRDWQQCSENDKSSEFKTINDNRIKSTGPNLIRNSNMTNSTQGWIAWPSPISIIHDKRSGIDGPSLRIQFPSGRSEGLLYYAGISLNSNKIYRLSFSAMSTAKSRIEFAPLMASAPWEALGYYACFSIDTVFKTFTYFFRPNKSYKNARVNFRSNAAFWIDNVTLSEVAPKKETAGESLLLIYNDTEKTKTIPLRGKFSALKGNLLSDVVTLPGYSSIVLLKHQ